MSARRAGVWVAAMLMVTPSAARAITIAEGGSARATIVVPADPIPAERAAARELASYLEKVTGARFDVRSEKGVPRGARQIHVGPTALALRLGLGPSRLGEEEWAIASEGRVLVHHRHAVARSGQLLDEGVPDPVRVHEHEHVAGTRRSRRRSSPTTGSACPVSPSSRGESGSGGRPGSPTPSS